MLMFGIILWTSIILGMLYVIIGLLKYYHRFSKVRKFDGPKQIFLFGNMLENMVAPDEMFKMVRNYGKLYFPAYKMFHGPYMSVNLLGPEEIERLVSTTKHMRKSRVYDLLVRWLGEGLLISSGVKWQTRRKILTPAFHFNILEQFVQIFNTETNRLLNNIEKQCNKPYVNIVPLITEFTLCTINETAMGTNLSRNSEANEDYRKTIFKLGALTTYRVTRPWLYNNFIYRNFCPNGWEEIKCIDILHKFSRKIIEDREKNFDGISMPTEQIIIEDESYSRRKKMAMLDLLLDAKRKGIIDNKGISEEVETFMFEGHDTTATALNYILMELASHPDIQDLVYKEIREIIGETVPTINTLQELKYTERCIKECLRLYPSVPFISRYADEDIILPSGNIIPKSCPVHIHIYDLHHSDRIYPDPEKFDPDRFLPENIQKRHPFAYLPFSAGPRNCIGQRFALLELKSALCGILTKFILKPVDTSKTIKLTIGIILWTSGGIRIKFVPRK